MEVRAAGGTRLVWHTGDATRPENMDELLMERGFERTQQLEVLAFELGDGPEARLPRLDAPAEITTMLARDAEGLREMHRISSQVLASAEPSEEEIAEYTKELEKLEIRKRTRASDDGGSLTLRFLACIHERDSRQVVASAGLQVAGKVGRLWGGGTLSPFRGRGAYRALVVERCRIVHALGATLALVKADFGTAAPILRRAGFRVASTEHRHVLKIPVHGLDC